jgi:small subunit ribosomal protein S6
MRSYELAYIADPDLDEQALTGLEERVRALVESVGGKPKKVDRWGKRRLAYPIRRKHEGYYVFVEADLPSRATAEIERGLRLNESLLRFLIVQS